MTAREDRQLLAAIRGIRRQIRAQALAAALGKVSPRLAAARVRKMARAAVLA